MLTPKRMQEIKRLASETHAATGKRGSRVCHCDRLTVALLDLISEIEECDKRRVQIPIVNSPEWVDGLCDRVVKLINRLKDTTPIFAYQVVSEEVGELTKYVATRASEGRIAAPMSCEKRCLGCLDAKFPHNPDCPEG